MNGRLFFYWALAILYFVFPWDLFPDSLGFIGRIDDLVLMAAVLSYTFTPSHPELPEPDPRASLSHLDPWEVLGVPRDADLPTIRAAYRDLAGRFHPDRGHHLSKEERDCAEDRMRDINIAYNDLVRRREPPG